MIKSRQAKRLKIHLKNDWINNVHLELKRAGVLNTRGQPYKESMIRHVLNGHRENLKIEAAIIKVYNDRKLAKKKFDSKKKQILAS